MSETPEISKLRHSLENLERVVRKVADQFSGLGHALTEAADWFRVHVEADVVRTEPMLEEMYAVSRELRKRHAERQRDLQGLLQAAQALSCPSKAKVPIEKQPTPSSGWADLRGRRLARELVLLCNEDPSPGKALRALGVRPLTVAADQPLRLQENKHGAWWLVDGYEDEGYLIPSPEIRPRSPFRFFDALFSCQGLRPYAADERTSLIEPAILRYATAGEWVLVKKGVLAFSDESLITSPKLAHATPADPSAGKQAVAERSTSNAPSQSPQPQAGPRDNLRAEIVRLFNKKAVQEFNRLDPKRAGVFRHRTIEVKVTDDGMWWLIRSDTESAYLLPISAMQLTEDHRIYGCIGDLFNLSGLGGMRGAVSTRSRSWRCPPRFEGRGIGGSL